MKKTMGAMTEPGGGTGLGRGRISISVGSLIGELHLGGKSKEGNLKNLAQAMAEAIMGELARYEGE